MIWFCSDQRGLTSHHRRCLGMQTTTPYRALQHPTCTTNTHRSFEHDILAHIVVPSLELPKSGFPIRLAVCSCLSRCHPLRFKRLQVARLFVGEGNGEKKKEKKTRLWWNCGFGNAVLHIRSLIIPAGVFRQLIRSCFRHSTALNPGFIAEFTVSYEATSVKSFSFP